MDIWESFVYYEESDFLTITRSGIAHEIEIKISRSDYLADFKKTKHSTINAVLSSNQFVTVPGTELNATSKINPWRTRLNPKTPEETSWYCTVYFRKAGVGGLPNKFSFAVPEGLVSKDEVPHYAGLYYITEDGEVKEIKRAKMIHKNPFNKWENMASKFYWQLKNERIRHRSLKASRQTLLNL